MSSVNICLHQDAILDLAKDASNWLAKIQAKAHKLMGPSEDSKSKKSSNVMGNQSPHVRLSRQKVVRRFSRQSSEEGSTGKPVRKTKVQW